MIVYAKGRICILAFNIAYGASSGAYGVDEKHIQCIC